jgi:Fe/S biogenesis protein NfuA
MTTSLDATADQNVTEPVISITDEARQIVIDALAAEPDPESMALWLEVRAIEAGNFVYDLYFQARTDAGDDDAVWTLDGLTTVVPARSVPRLTGAKLEFSNEGEGGLVIVNPNRPGPELGAQIPAEVLSQGINGVLGRRITDLLEAAVNPSIASHGGRCDLVAVDEIGKHAYVKLSGGCQGCAMSRMTLSEGIETMLRSEIPDLGDLIDVTDHGSGDKPYY